MQTGHLFISETNLPSEPSASSTITPKLIHVFNNGTVCMLSKPLKG